MHPLKKNYIIMGLVMLLALSFEVKSVFAIYSPRLSEQMNVIRQHIINAQSKNGKGTAMEAIQKIIDYDKKKTAAGEETGIPGQAKAAQKLVFQNSLEFIINNPFDSLMMVFNYNSSKKEWISNCLRNDIWSLEVLRDLVADEMIKSYLLWNPQDGDILKTDYLYLLSQLSLLRKYGSDPYALISDTKNGENIRITSNEYFFGTEPQGPDAINYYVNANPSDSGQVGCSNSEFGQAFEQVKRSWNTLKVLGSGEGVEWGSVWGMAQANARIRAREWIRANQLSLTLGGEEGGRPESLVSGGGWDAFVGDFKTQLNILKNMVGPVTPLFDVSLYQPPKGVKSAIGNGKDCVYYYHEDGVFRDCSKDQVEQYKKCKSNEEQAKKEGIRCDRFQTTEDFSSFAAKANRQLALYNKNAQTLEEAANTFTYSMSLDSIAEQNIYFMDEALWEMNMQIKRGYEGVDQNAGKGIPSLTREIAELSAKQCANQQ